LKSIGAWPKKSWKIVGLDDVVELLRVAQPHRHRKRRLARCSKNVRSGSNPGNGDQLPVRRLRELAVDHVEARDAGAEVECLEGSR
jgi:hypothetical protein